MDNYIDRIFRICEIKGLRDADLAKITGIRPQSISGWRRGKAGPSGESLVRLVAEWTEVDARWLLTGIDSKSDQLTNNQSGSHNINQQGSGNQVADPGATVWKERFEAAERIIREKEEQINILKSVLKI